MISTRAHNNRRPIAPADYNWIYSTIMSHGEPNERALFLFLMLTGLLRTEATLLQAEHFDPAACKLFIHRSEIGRLGGTSVQKQRYLYHRPLGNFTASILEARIKEGGTNNANTIFATMFGNPVGAKTKLDRALGARPDIIFCVPLLRKCFESVAADVGLSPTERGLLLGDAWAQDARQRYTGDQLKAWAQRIEDRILSIAQAREVA